MAEILVPSRQTTELTRALSVLIADDTAVVRALLDAALRRAGHAVETVDNGLAVVAKLRESTYDIIIMDMQMPFMCGLEATRAIRALANDKSRIPIIGLTAANFLDVQEFLAGGVNAVLNKPVKIDALLMEINSVLPRR